VYGGDLPESPSQSTSATPPPGEGFWISQETMRIIVRGIIGLALIYLFSVGADPSILGPILKSLKV
jgi:hypothetical protein